MFYYKKFQDCLSLACKNCKNQFKSVRKFKLGIKKHFLKPVHNLSIITITEN